MAFFYSIIIGSFILEDVALLSTLALISEDKISFELGFLAIFLGISLGDIGLYFLGRLIPIFGDKISYLKKISTKAKQSRNIEVLDYAIFISRLIPGSRTITYIAAGLMNYSAFKFIIYTLISVAFWVGMVLYGGKALLENFKSHFILGAISVLLLIYLIRNVIPQFFDQWDRKAYLKSFFKYKYFEFWPAWFFYLPIVPKYFYLSYKYKSLLTPLYANPLLINGGLIGESKWDVLKYLASNDPSTLKTVYITKQNLNQEYVESQMNSHQISYPFILKPDIGQRGYGVRIIRSIDDLTRYLRQSDFALVLQSLSPYQKEAGIFYIRLPNQENGFIFSITDKEFPTVLGNGKR